MADLPPSPRRNAILSVVVAVVAVFVAKFFLDRLFWQDLAERRGAVVRITGDGDVYAVELNSPEFDDHDVAMAARIPTLQRLELEGADITDRSVVAISRAEALKELNLSRTAITDAELPRLSGLHQLQELRLNHCPEVTGASVAQLHDLPGLQRLNLEGIEVSFSDLTQVQANIPGVNIQVDPKALLGIPDADRSVLAGWHGRRRYESDDPYGINLQCHFEVTGEWLTSLKNPEAAVELSMRAATSDAVEALQRFTRLRSVSVTRCNDHGAAVLAGLRELRSLVLQDSSITDAGLKDLTRLEHLQYLYIVSPNIRGDSLVALQDLHDLLELTLICPDAEPGEVTAGLPALAHLSQLGRLHLELPIADGRALQPLRNCLQLYTLVLRNCGLTDESLEQLGVLPQVVDLALTNESLTGACMDTLNQWPSLRQVSLDDEVSSALPPEAVDGRIRILSD